MTSEEGKNRIPVHHQKPEDQPGQAYHTNAESNGSNANLVWIGVGVGAAAVGVALALARRKKNNWSTAKQVSRRLADKTNDLAEVGKDIFDRIKVIYNESRKVVEECNELWSHGRKLAGV